MPDEKRLAMIDRIRLLALLLAVPLIGFGAAEGIRARLNSGLRSVIQRENPDLTGSELAHITVDLLCREFSSELPELCGMNNNLNLLSRVSIGAGAVGLLLLLLIHIAGRVARNNRTLLVFLFTPGLYLTALVLIGLIILHAAIAIVTLFYISVVFPELPYPRIILALSVGALIGVIAMIRGLFSTIRKARTFVIGKSLRREHAPDLWMLVEEAAQRLGSLKPDHIVVGLDPNFFVTEADVASLSGSLKGRTLYCSLPLCRILSVEELTSVIGHELGHFKGQDTKFSRYFYPIYAGTVSALATLHATQQGFSSIPMLPAIAVLSYFLESFSVAERRLSRERELEADRVGASLTSPRALASALVKLHAFIGLWEGWEGIIAALMRQGIALENISQGYADLVLQNARPEALQGIAEGRLAHPTDSHPPLAVRLQSLQIGLDDAANDALAVRPPQAAITLIPDAEKLEEEISQVYCLLLARRLGISVGKG
jgi:Zn-dependent protease with chaperone function